MSGVALALAAVILGALTCYVLLAGADFGGGVWDLFAQGERAQAQRNLIARAIGPVWEANHVWLILVIVVLFSCFPAVFAALTIKLHVPLSLMLVGIVLRGSAFTFRAFDSQRDVVQQRWGRIFAIASVVTPVLLGMNVAAISAGVVTEEASPLGAGFAAVYLWPWMTAYGLAVGVLALSLFAFLAAVYLTVEAEGTTALQEDFRTRALAAALVVGVAALVSLLLARTTAPLVRTGLTTSSWALPLHMVTALAALAAVAALWTRRWQLGRVAAAAQATCILWGWAVAQYPYLLPPSVTIDDAAAPPATLRLILWALAAGAVVLFPSLAWLFRVFKTGVKGGGRGGSRVY
ncbi:MAG: cytochrome d ubiquinol oxidase subunit II [Gemmatimonadaceae bacterium]